MASETFWKLELFYDNGTFEGNDYEYDTLSEVRSRADRYLLADLGPLDRVVTRVRIMRCQAVEEHVLEVEKRVVTRECE